MDPAIRLIDKLIEGFTNPLIGVLRPRRALRIAQETCWRRLTNIQKAREASNWDAEKDEFNLLGEAIDRYGAAVSDARRRKRRDREWLKYQPASDFNMTRDFTKLPSAIATLGGRKSERLRAANG